MASKNISLNDSYLPVAWEYREIVEEAIKTARKGKIFFFNKGQQVDEVKGKIVGLEEEKSAGVFLVLNTGAKVRLDRIITVFGKVGAAYDEYDSYANACLDCMGGYDKDDV